MTELAPQTLARALIALGAEARQALEDGCLEAALALLRHRAECYAALLALPPARLVPLLDQLGEDVLASDRLLAAELERALGQLRGRLAATRRSTAALQGYTPRPLPRGRLVDRTL